MWESCGLKLLGLVLVNVISLCIANTEIRTIDWMLQETLFTKLCSTKKMLTVNGMFPGPALYLHQGERIKVNVHNQGKYGVTIHWHGVKQPRNPWSDGPEYVTQCPIKSGANYTYEIILSDEEGTLWWHAHSDWSRATVHGPIFVYPKPGKQYPYPTESHTEIPIFLASWYKGDVMQNIQDALASGGETNKSDAFTINGQPGDTQPCSTKDMFTMTVEHGNTYLLRIINGVMNEEMFFMVANHKLVVVGIDAAYVKPITTTYIMITPGQTMDVLLKANQSPSHYYMAARAFGVVFSNATTTALIRYTGDYEAPPKAAFPTLPAYDANDAAIAFTRRFRALHDESDVPQKVDRRILMTLAVETLPCEEGEICTGPNNNKISASMNNVTFDAPKIDILQAYWKHLKHVYKTDFPDKPPYIFNYTMSPMIGNDFIMSDVNGTRVIVIDYNATVEIVFQGTNVLNGSENHPIHLHGYSFYVVGWGKGIFDVNKSPWGYNLKDPAKVNTIGVPKNGWTAIRFKAHNPEWPGSYCDTQKTCCYPTTGKPESDFGIHGLWPNYNDGSYPSNCDSSNPFQISKVSDLVSKMQSDWPTLACPSGDGIDFWTNEWETHGTCSESVLDQHGYFKSALNLKNQINHLQALANAGIEPNGGSYNLQSIKEAVKQGTGYTPFVECNRDESGNSQLYQLYFCVDSSVSAVECSVFPHGKCGSQIQFPSF